MSLGLDGPQSLLGRVVAGYRLDRVLGTGLFGVVYLARRATTPAAQSPPQADRTDVGTAPTMPTMPIPLAALPQPETVAIKILVVPIHMKDAVRAELQVRFTREAEALERLHHPHILPVIAHGEENGISYIILRYVGGGTLDDQVTEGPLPLDEVARILTQIADALDDAHRQRVVHRDIKPANILLDEHGNVFVSDFGIAHMMGGADKTLTAVGWQPGTPEYMAPEQARGEKEIGPAADIYSLGVLAYEMVTGQVPYSNEQWYELVQLITRGNPLAPRDLRPDLPRPAEAAILKAMAVLPAERFATARAFADSFAEGLGGVWQGVPPKQAAAASMPPRQGQPPFSPPIPRAGAGSVYTGGPVPHTAAAPSLAPDPYRSASAGAGALTEPFPTRASSTASPAASDTPTLPVYVPHPAYAAPGSATPYGGQQAVAFVTPQSGTPVRAQSDRRMVALVAVPAAILLLILAILLRSALLGGGSPNGLPGGPGALAATRTAGLPTVTAAPTRQPTTTARSNPTATSHPSPTATPNLQPSGHLTLATDQCSGPYPRLVIGNTGTGTLTWSGTTSSTAYALSPPSGSVQPRESRTADIIGPSPASNALTVTITSSGGVSSIDLSPCSSD